MKKVLSAVVLSAAVVASAGQAYAYGDFHEMNFLTGSLVQVMYNDTNEAYYHNGNFITDNNPSATADYAPGTTTKLTLNKTTNVDTVLSTHLLSNLGGTGTVKMTYFLDDVSGDTVGNDPIMVAYFASTSDIFGGVTNLTSTKFMKWNQSMANILGHLVEDTPTGSDEVTVAKGTGGYYTAESIKNNKTAGQFFGLNSAAAYGEAVLDSSPNLVDFNLWSVRRNTQATPETIDDVYTTEIVATLQYNKTTGQTILNATPVAPVPVPAAAWLLGSGLLGMIGLRRRK